MEANTQSAFVLNGLVHKRVMYNELASLYVVEADPVLVQGTPYQYLDDGDYSCFDVIANSEATPLAEDPSINYPSEDAFFRGEHCTSYVGDLAFKDELFVEAVIAFKELTEKLGKNKEVQLPDKGGYD